MGQVIRVRLTGTNAELGTVAASDVAKLLIGTERAVRASASRILDKPITTGRWGKLIEQVSSFRFVSIERGSVVAVLELPELEPQDESFELETGHLGHEALDAMLATLRGSHDDPYAAAALTQLAEELGIGARLDAVEFIVDRQPPAVLDGPARARLQGIAASDAVARPGDAVVGTLVEADFEKGTARLRTLDGGGVKVTFDSSLADDIKEALRETAELVGMVAYDPLTAVAKSVHLQHISRAEQLALAMETGQFWLNVSVQEQQASQGATPVEDLADLTDPDLSDAEANAFLAAIGADA